MVSHTKTNTSDVYKWLIAVGLPLFILLIPVSETFTSEARMFLVLSIMAILVIGLRLNGYADPFYFVAYRLCGV